MSSIRIIETPPGPAPEPIRKAWVNLVLPLAVISESERARIAASTTRWGNDNMNGHVVHRDDAVQALVKAGKTEAALFWSNPGYKEYLEFRKEVCEILP